MPQDYNRYQGDTKTDKIKLAISGEITDLMKKAGITCGSRDDRNMKKKITAYKEKLSPMYRSRTPRGVFSFEKVLLKKSPFYYAVEKFFGKQNSIKPLMSNKDNDKNYALCGSEDDEDDEDLLGSEDNK